MRPHSHQARPAVAAEPAGELLGVVRTEQQSGSEHTPEQQGQNLLRERPGGGKPIAGFALAPLAVYVAPRLDGWWARRQRARGFTPALGAEA